MKFIVKKPEPIAFINWREGNDYKPTLYSELPSNPPLHPEEGIYYYSRKELTEALLIEQGFICCYCNRRLQVDKVTLEHLETQTENPDKVLVYDNLMASCDGGYTQTQGEKIKIKSAFCNNRRGSLPIYVHPLQIDCATKFYFNVENGEIKGKNESAQTTINNLNLACDYLNDERKAVISGFIFDNPEDEFSDFIAPEEARLLIAKLEQQNLLSTHFQPFYMAVLNALKFIAVSP